MLINNRLYIRIEQKKAELDSLRPFPKTALGRLRERFALLITYNSNAIEGNTLSLSETRMVIEDGITIGGRSVRDHFEAINHKKAIDYLETLSRVKINEAHLCKLNNIILNNVEEEERGIYRKRKVWVEGASFVPAMPALVPKLMKQFYAWFNRNKLNTIELSAIAHEKLVFIHPFIDGNGRVARLLTNLILMQKGYPPALILKTERKKYIRTLEQAHNEQYQPFVDFIGRAVERSLIMYLEALKIPSEEDEKYILLSEACKTTPYSQEYLSYLARTGKLEAVKFGRNWMTTDKAVSDYIKKVR